MEVRVLNHSAYRTQYHIVWVTKFRHRVLKPANFKIKVEAVIKDIDEEMIKKYVKYQKKQDSGQAKLEF